MIIRYSDPWGIKNLNKDPRFLNQIPTLPGSLESARSVPCSESLLGGSWVVISGITIVIDHTRALITLLLTTHEPPSRLSQRRRKKQGRRCLQKTLTLEGYLLSAP